MALRGKCPYGKAVFDHLAAHGAGFPGSQVAVVTVGQVDAHFLGSLHLELVHSLTGLGNVDLVVILHTVFSPFVVFSESLPPSNGKRLFLSANIALPERNLVCQSVFGKVSNMWKTNISEIEVKNFLKKVKKLLTNRNLCAIILKRLDD